ncbi:MAG: TonB-dependent siderophore receptor [Pseudomonadota bacterium]
MYNQTARLLHLRPFAPCPEPQTRSITRTLSTVLLAGTCLSLMSWTSPHTAFAQEQDQPANEDSQPSTEGTAPQQSAEDVEELFIEGRKYGLGETSSATKTPTQLVDVPQSLSVVSRTQLDDQAMSDMGDILRFTPGASIAQGEGHRDQIIIRGQNTTADFFIDGLRDDVQYFRPLYNLERVEILRGSNALAFGRGGGGGVINRVSKTPETGNNFFESSVAADTFGQVAINGDANIELGDHAAFRLNAFYENLDNHRDFFGGERFAINPTVGFELTPDTRVVASYEYVNDDRVVDRGVPAQDGVPLMGFDNTFFGDPDFNETEFEGHIGRIKAEHSFSDNWSVNATFQYADYDKLYQNLFPIGSDVLAGSVSLDGYIDTTDRRNLLAQVNLLGQFETGFITHTVVFGAEYADQDTVNTRQDTFFLDTQDDQITFPFSDPLVIPAVTFPAFNRDRFSEVEVWSFYAQDQIDLGRYVKAVFGVRYDRFDVKVEDSDLPVLIANDGEPIVVESLDTEFSPRVGLIFKPLENVSIYGSFSRSFLPRTGDQFLTLTIEDAALDAEEFLNFEVGAKWDINPNFSLTAAIFRLDRESGVLVDPTDVDNTILVGSQTDGLELQLIGNILENWSINVGYAYTDADQVGNVVDGKIMNMAIPQVPEHMFSLWSRYDATERLGFGLGVTYQSSQFASISNAVELPGFARVDIGIFYQLTDHVHLQINVENLLDSDYFPAAHNDNNISTGEPINARFRITGRF